MQENIIDKRVRLYKAISGVIPGGSFIVEYMVDRIPDQRMERFFKFVEELKERVEKLENTDFFKSDNFSILAEAAIIESSRVYSNQRLAWLASIAIPSLTPSENELEYRKKAVDILAELSDADVECLLNHTSWEQKIKYEQALATQISLSIGDRENLSSHELFEINLSNQRLTLYRNSLLNKGLVEIVTSERRSDYRVTEAGNLFIYVITDEYPRLR